MTTDTPMALLFTMFEQAVTTVNSLRVKGKDKDPPFIGY